MTTLCRDLKELWLFGGLDTLADPTDEEENRTKAAAVAEMIEALATQPPAGTRSNGTGAAVAKSENINGA